MQDTDNEEDFHALLSKDAYDYRFDIGVSQPVKSLKFSKKYELILCIMKHFAIHQVKAELDQILCGLSETLHTLDVIRHNPTLFRPLFVYFERPPLTGDQLYDLLLPKYSLEGSNMKEKEEAVTMLWVDFLQELQGKLSCVCVWSSPNRAHHTWFGTPLTPNSLQPAL